MSTAATMTLIAAVLAPAVYMHTGNNPYPRRGVRQWVTYWSMVVFVMTIPAIVLTREIPAALAITVFVTLPTMLILYYRNKANRLPPADPGAA